MASNSQKTASASTKPLSNAIKTHKQQIIALLISIALLFGGACVAGGIDDSRDRAQSPYSSTAYNNAASSKNPTQPDTHSDSDEHTNTAPISPYQAVYQSQVKGITAELQQSLKQTTAEQWQLTNVVNVLFTGFDEQSHFSIDNNQVRPTLYHYNNPMSKSRSSELHFDQKRQTVIDKDHPKSPLNITPLTTDKLSAQLQIRLDMIREGNTYSGKAYSVVDSTKLKTYHTEIVGEEPIDVFAGKFNAIKIKQYRRGKDKYQLIWLAKDHQYLILRLDVIDKGKLRDSLQLKNASIDGNDISG